MANGQWLIAQNYGVKTLCIYLHDAVCGSAACGISLCGCKYTPEGDGRERYHIYRNGEGRTTSSKAETGSKGQGGATPRKPCMSKDGADKPANAGNPYAKQDTVTTASGTGGGLNPVGNDALDEGLQGRGLVGSLPQPIYPPGNYSGKVVVSVKVNKSGVVTEAAYQPIGSTLPKKAFIDAAIAAARKARFTESAAFVQGGTITYVFKTK